MISLSNLIKSTSVVSIDQLRELYWKNKYAALAANANGEAEAPEEEQPDEETITLRDQIIADARQFAEESLREMGAQCEQMLTDAEANVEAWWLEKRLEDEATTEAARSDGYERGFAEGIEQANMLAKQEWEQKLFEANSILASAYTMREQIIQEAEPFLVELSCAVAEKVIGQQLEQAPEMVIELIKKSLARRREQGVITLCVAPGQLAFVQAAQEELNLAVDSQAELQILPDATVKDFGCVIRSAYGSIDARIDTQLSELKRELVQFAHQSRDERGQADEQ